MVYYCRQKQITGDFAMDKPANISPMSLTDIANMARAEINEAQSRQNEEAATANRETKRTEEAAKREMQRTEEAAKRAAALRAGISSLRKDMKERDIKAAEREKRQLWQFGGIVVGIAALMTLVIGGLGLWAELRDTSAASPITVNIPPAIQTTPPPARQ